MLICRVIIGKIESFTTMQFEMHSKLQRNPRNYVPVNQHFFGFLGKYFKYGNVVIGATKHHKYQSVYQILSKLDKITDNVILVQITPNF